MTLSSAAVPRQHPAFRVPCSVSRVPRPCEKAYKTQVCPHGNKCRSKAFCPHAHLLGCSSGRTCGGASTNPAALGAGSGSGSGVEGVAGVVAGGRRTRSAGGTGMGRGNEGMLGGIAGMGLRRASSRPSTPEGSAEGRPSEEEWQTVGRRGRRAASSADGEGQVRCVCKRSDVEAILKSC